MRRRTLLAAGAAFLGSGCIKQSQSLLDRSNPERVSLQIKTVPADADPAATMLARTLAQRLDAVGIDASVTLRSKEELYRDILLNQTFDAYVARHPRVTDPDFLRPLLHSRFGGESGWQNPFGYTNLELDGILEAQRTASGSTRTGLLREVEAVVARDQPFTVVTFPDEIRAVRTDRVRPPDPRTPHTALHYLAATPATEASTGPSSTAGGTSDAERDLRVTIGDARPTENLNPLAVEFRTGLSVTDLLYDPVGRRVDGQVRPWLASDWTWESGEGDGPRALVSLREGLTWHDGTPLTPADVAFTYRFLRDTSLGDAETPVPAPGYRGETSLVESVGVRNDGRVELQFGPVSRRVATRAFTVPVLPEREWAERSRQATIAGVDTGDPATEALVWNNMTPVGSGPLRFEQASPTESLVLRRFEDHFLDGEVESEALAPFTGGFAFDTLTFSVVPSTAAAVKLLATGTGALSGSPLSQNDVPRIGRTEELRLQVTRPTAFYHLGYNTRNAPTSNTRFRRAVAGLVDKSQVARELFGGYADPAASPLARHPVHDPTLDWDGEDPATPFLGSNGQLDTDRAREAFREAGYRYSDDGALLHR